MQTREVEIRFQISIEEHEVLLNKLAELGWQSESSEQKDSYFCDSRQAPKDRTYVVRLRESKQHKLAYKSFMENGHWIEIETGVEDPASMRSILEKLGQQEFLSISKRRLSGKLDGFEINLDSIDGLGEFIELETMTVDSEKGKTDLMLFAQKIQLPEDRVVARGYVQLMEDKVGSDPRS